jgi:hypothetical protein
MEEELKRATQAKKPETKPSSFNAVVQRPPISSGMLTLDSEADLGVAEWPLFPYPTESPFGVLARPGPSDFAVDFQGTTNIAPHISIFSRRVFKTLPPRDEAQLLIKKSFQGFISGYPIFTHATCVKMLECYDQSLEDPSWWACVNVVLAMAHRFRAMKTLNNHKEDREAWGYLKNALAVVTELTMMHPKLTSVQALLGMAMIIQGAPNSRPYSALLSSAMRLAQTMGLHRENEDLNLDLEELEERKQVFWVGFFLDKDLSLQNGQPPTQDDDEMDVGLPIRTFKQLAHPSRVNFFELRMRLALIQGQIYKRLCSVKAQRQSLTERLYAVAELETMLHDWRDSVPIDFTEDYFFPAESPFFRPLFQEVIARLTYFKSLNTVHRHSVFGMQSEHASQNSNRHESGYVLPDPITCALEARKAIQLLHVTPQGDYACIW